MKMKKIVVAVLCFVTALASACLFACAEKEENSLIYVEKKFVESGVAYTVDGETANKTYSRFVIAVSNHGEETVEFKAEDFTIIVKRNGEKLFEGKGDTLVATVSYSGSGIIGDEDLKTAFTTKEKAVSKPNSGEVLNVDVLLFGVEVQSSDEVSFLYKGASI